MVYRVFKQRGKDIPPLMNSDKCHFEHWLKGKGVEQYGQHLDFLLLVKIHERLHVLGQELVALYKQGEHTEAQLREVELLAIYSEQIKKIEEIVS